MKYCKIMELNWEGFEINYNQRYNPRFITSFCLSDQQ